MSTVGDPNSLPVARRDPILVAVLSTVTLGIYLLYLVYQWCRELNGLVGRPKYNPGLLLLISIVTCCLGGIVVECMFAHELETLGRARAIPSATGYLTLLVVSMNVGGLLLSLTGYGLILSIPLGAVATGLVQNELNKFASSA